jgi:hypothetical protein
MNLSGTVYHPELGQMMEWNAEPLSTDPDTQVAQTIQRMRRHVLEDSQSEPILKEAELIQGYGSGDPLSDTFWHVKNKVGFRQDRALAQPFRGLLDGDVVEVLIRPRDLATMNRPLEDCDGFSSYGPALLRAQGIPCRFVTVAADAREPGRFSHVYTVCREPQTGQRISLDISHGGYPGWECTETGQVTRVKEWPIDGPDWLELLLLAGVLFLAAKFLGVL